MLTQGSQGPIVVLLAASDTVALLMWEIRQVKRGREERWNPVVAAAKTNFGWSVQSTYEFNERQDAVGHK